MRTSDIIMKWSINITPTRSNERELSGTHAFNVCNMCLISIIYFKVGREKRVKVYKISYDILIKSANCS